MTKEEREKAIKALKWFKEYNEEDYCGGDRIQDEHGDWYYRITEQDLETFDMIIKALEQELKEIPVSEKYEHHIDHTDCIWYGNNSGCPVTCSQYRDGWNDAMDYIFKNGDGYRPYRRNENR